MRRTLVIAGLFALTAAVGPGAAFAESDSMSGSATLQAKSSGSASLHTRTHANVAGTRSLARADLAAGTHGLQGRNVARTRGSHRTGFCPPGQAKKPGLGSRFHC